jgi:hypothetical protein
MTESGLPYQLFCTQRSKLPEQYQVPQRTECVLGITFACGIEERSLSEGADYFRHWQMLSAHLMQRFDGDNLQSLDLLYEGKG